MRECQLCLIMFHGALSLRVPLHFVARCAQSLCTRRKKCEVKSEGPERGVDGWMECVSQCTQPNISWNLFIAQSQ